jgi:uncharacterized repeat protein (TIGR01451 family)
LVSLDGSGSSDADGDALLYHWVQRGGPPVTLSDPNAAGPTFTAPATVGLLTFELTVTDPFGSDTDTTAVRVALPELAISKSGPAQVEAGDPILYTLVIKNNGFITASSLVIIDALPTGASFVEASHSGVLNGSLVSWTVPSLGPGAALSLTFTVTAAESVTNADYRVSCAEGVSAVGQVAVVTTVRRTYMLYLPVVAWQY